MIVLIACYGVTVLALALGLYLFVTLKRELWILNERWRRKQAAWEAAAQDLHLQVQELNERLKETEEQAGIVPPPAPPKSGLNLSNRGQALRMFRRGESPEQIAAALSLPRNEVELLIKVHRISLDALAPVGPEPPEQVDRGTYEIE